jgi:hypothetical protein
MRVVAVMAREGKKTEKVILRKISMIRDYFRIE